MSRQRTVWGQKNSEINGCWRIWAEIVSSGQNDTGQFWPGFGGGIADCLDRSPAKRRGRISLVRPLPEAADLLGCAPAVTEAERVRQGRALRAMGPRAVLMKGGHAEGADCVDLLISDTDVLRLTAPRHPTRNTHGTGCTLSAAIAAGLAQGQGLEPTLHQAHAYLQGAIAAADGLRIGAADGGGHGPVHHFHKVWAHG